MTQVEHLESGHNRYTYRTHGKGPDVLFVHGWLSSSRMWEKLMLHLADDYRTWAIDLAGFGDSYSGSKLDDAAFSVEDQVCFVADFCQTANLHPHAVIGHSMGGAIALKLALDYPHLFDRLGLVCPVVTGKFHWSKRLFLNMMVHKGAFKIGYQLWQQLVTVPGAYHLAARPYLQREAVLRNVEDFRKAAWNAAYDGARSLVDIRLDRRLHEVSKPTMVITGTRDDMAPPSDGRLVAQVIPNAQYVEFTCHHLPHDEVPERFHEAIGDFLVGANAHIA